MILVVEDHPDMIDHIRRELAAEFEVLEAQRGDVGPHLATDRIPELILSDVMMPGLVGFELCKALRADARTSHVPVILLTAKGFELPHEQIREQWQLSSIMVKPFSPRELVSTVEQLIAELWASPPETGLKALHQRVAKLREYVVFEGRDDPSPEAIAAVAASFRKAGVVEKAEKYLEIAQKAYEAAAAAHTCPTRSSCTGWRAYHVGFRSGFTYRC